MVRGFTKTNVNNMYIQVPSRVVEELVVNSSFHSIRFLEKLQAELREKDSRINALEKLVRELADRPGGLPSLRSGKPWMGKPCDPVSGKKIPIPRRGKGGKLTPFQRKQEERKIAFSQKPFPRGWRRVKVCKVPKCDWLEVHGNMRTHFRSKHPALLSEQEQYSEDLSGASAERIRELHKIHNEKWGKAKKGCQSFQPK